jgi:hypothetical protein
LTHLWIEVAILVPLFIAAVIGLLALQRRRRKPPP